MCKKDFIHKTILFNVIFLFKICVCENNFLFLGSRLGNSLLLRFVEKEKSQVITLDDSNEPNAKRSKTCEEKILDSLNDCMASDVMDIKDPVELEVYGNEKQTSLEIKSYTFEAIF